ncbi:MAG TPA: hypothetical protein PLP11_10270 [Bacteroidales bacterium]|nr:hypothetical protein [Bacteroidales bacterium]
MSVAVVLILVLQLLISFFKIFYYYSEIRGIDVQVTVIFPRSIATYISVNSGLTVMQLQETGSEKNSVQTMPTPDVTKMIIGAMEKNRLRVCVGQDFKFLDFL